MFWCGGRLPAESLSRAETRALPTARHPQAWANPGLGDKVSRTEDSYAQDRDRATVPPVVVSKSFAGKSL